MNALDVDGNELSVSVRSQIHFRRFLQIKSTRRHSAGDNRSDSRHTVDVVDEILERLCLEPIFRLQNDSMEVIDYVDQTTTYVTSRKQVQKGPKVFETLAFHARRQEYRNDTAVTASERLCSLHGILRRFANERHLTDTYGDTVEA